MLTCFSTSRLGWLLFCFATAIALTSVSSAEQVGTKDNLDAAGKAMAKDRGEFLAGKKVDAANKNVAKKVVTDAADYYLYRITHRSSYKFQAVQDEFARDMEAAKKSDASFKALLGPALVASMRNVLAEQKIDKGDGVIIVNAAMMLPTMGRLKQDDVGNYLVELVNAENTHQIVRFYASKALKEYMPITLQPNDNDLDLTKNAKRKQDAAYVDALVKFIEHPPEVKSMSQPEMEAVRFVRREAIISLAQAGAPAVLAVNKKSQVKKDLLEGPVAPTLLKVLAKDGLQPPPTLQEKVEAVLGLCAMRYADMPEYNPDVATYLIGQTLTDFASEYSVDLGNFGKGVEKKKIPFLPWKHDAKRLKDGLKKFADNTGTPSAKALNGLAEPILKSIAEHESVNVNALRTQLQAPDWLPKDNKAFKTLKTPAIPLK
jgi:hypothetical protein